MTPIIPTRAIELAIEGGWKNDFVLEAYNYSSFMASAALDPAFWQALVKNLRPQNETRALWLVKAEQFAYLILTNGDTDKFWDELLKA